MAGKKIVRLLLVIGLVGGSSGLVAYSCLAVKHQVGSSRIGDAVFTKLSHEGFIVRGADGRLGLAEGYVIKGGEAVWAEDLKVAEPSGAGPGSQAATAAAKTPPKKSPPKLAPKTPAPKKPTPKKPGGAKPKCPT